MTINLNKYMYTEGNKDQRQVAAFNPHAVVKPWSQVLYDLGTYKSTTSFVPAGLVLASSEARP